MSNSKFTSITEQFKFKPRLMKKMAMELLWTASTDEEKVEAEKAFKRWIYVNVDEHFFGDFIIMINVANKIWSDATEGKINRSNLNDVRICPTCRTQRVMIGTNSKGHEILACGHKIVFEQIL
jgi:hypothetical protein